ncbi:MAG: methylmalonyl-CoA mutase family protein [candidate division Zixibacteria bacterium]|nr:methylmalonyl-CoA mutase family protein [candidate division Zixibacteria bacterium]
MAKSRKTSSGIEIPITSNHRPVKLPAAGEYPFTRGIYPDMYRGRPWTMRQYAGFGTARETNRRFKNLLESGQTGLSVAFDLPTQIGYDSDHPLAAGEVGKTGVAIDTVDDMEALFEGIPLGEVSTSMTINATAAVLLAMYIVVARKQGVGSVNLRGTIQNDILKEFVARGTYIFPPQPSLRLVTDIFAYAKDYLPNFNTISISGYHIREAGSTAAQEIAFTFADAICYIETALAAGLEIDQFAPRLSFFFNVHNNLFEEIAKFRAARRIWARIVKERFGARERQSLMLRFHTQTAGSTLTAQQPENNIVRVTLQALAAVLGGTQSLHTNSYDEALALPTDKSATLALRTQQIIACESGVADSADPLGGSYFLEYLTDELEKCIFEILGEVDGRGGALKAIESGYFQRQIAQAAYEHQKQVESREEIVVGVNKYQADAEKPPDIYRVDPELEPRQVSRLREVKAGRPASRVAAALASVEKAAETGENLMPPILEAVIGRATLGEICDRLRKVWGEYHAAL